MRDLLLQVGGTGKQHIAAMILGFALFLPSLYFREFLSIICTFKQFIER